MRLYQSLKRHALEWVGLFSTPIGKLSLWLNGANYGMGLRIRGKLLVHNLGEILIGNNVSINSAVWANPIGGGTRCCFQVSPGGKIVIGDDCGLSNIAITSRTSVTLGKHVRLGAGCRIYDTDFHELAGRDTVATKPVVLQDDVFCGSGALILKGVTIGKGAIIGANAVVTKDVPAYEIWAGNPARCVKKIEAENE